MCLKYFAYGSNMSCKRLGKRVSSARSLGCYYLKKHDLKYHKRSTDGSMKCDADHTGDDKDVVYGVLFEICSSDKCALDKAEGANSGHYEEKKVTVFSEDGTSEEVFTYVACGEHIDKEISSRPYSWYKDHVLIGAREGGFLRDILTLSFA
ncbi:MAG: gamma-glutamylcyclotransferase family protein [Alphaproteobacteria bacterium]